MTPQIPAGDPPLASSVPAEPPRPPHSVTRGRGWVLLGAGALLLLAGGAVVCWRLWRPRPAPPADPPALGAVSDPEVLAVLQAARQEVLNDPRSAGAWGRLGMMLEANLYEAEAECCFVEAARLDPADARWPYLHGMYALKYDPDAAVPPLRQAAAAASLPELRSAARLRLAEALLERERLDEAEGIFRDELSRRPEEVRAVFGLGLIAVARGDDRAAEERLNAARSSTLTRKKATAQLAALARARGDEAAADAYEKEAAALPDDPSAWPDPFIDQVVQFQTGAYTRAQDVQAMEREHRYADAARAYLQQVKERPTAQAYGGAGLNLARTGDYDQALPLLREAVRLDPESAKAHYTLAQAQFSRAEKESRQTQEAPGVKAWFGEAAGHARKAAALKPDYAEAYLLWGVCLSRLGDPAAAVEPLRKGVDCRPGDLELQLTLGEALLELGRGREAATHLDNARQIDPNDPRPARDLERLKKGDK